VAFNRLEDTNALLLYRVGPVLMCSPTLQVESVIVPPAISRVNASSDAEPGMFRSMYGMVRVVDLRVRFGVDAAQRKQPGQIVIVEVTGGHAGFWVDEIEDVIAFPQTGWSQVPSHVPGSVFSRALLQENDIRLYAEFDRLDSFKASGYLREHIRKLQQTAQQETAETQESTKPAAPVQPQVLTSTLNHTGTTATTQAEVPAETDKQSISRSANAPSENQAAKKTETPFVAARSGDSQHVQVKPGNKLHPQATTHRQTISHRETDSDAAKERRGTVESHRPSPAVKTRVQSRKIPAVHEKAGESVAVSANKTNSIGYAGLQRQVPQPASAAEQTGSNWLWWLVPLLLLFVVLFILMQNSRLLQSLIAQDENSSLQTRVNLEKSTTGTQQEQGPDNDISLYASSEPAVDTSIDPAAKIKAGSTVQVADDLTDTIYIEPGSGDLTITVNDYEEDDLAQDASPVETSVQSQLPVQADADAHQALQQETDSQDREAETEYEQAVSLSETEIADSERVPADKKQDQSEMEISEGEMLEPAAVEDVTVEKTAQLTSRRLQHIVVKGDTLWSITERYINKPWRYPEIARLSNIDNPHLIYPGQRVIIVLNYKNQSD
jgi:nucleoid-associated protein YgaU/chemotaxis signal transduction protein